MKKSEEALPHMEKPETTEGALVEFIPFSVTTIMAIMFLWPSVKAKADNLEQLKEIQKAIRVGNCYWTNILLLNETIRNWELSVCKTGVHICIFRSMATCKRLCRIWSQMPNILMTHDPSHWRAEVLNNHPEINLTLSGHTHGFQFGVEIPALKLSGVRYNMFIRNGLTFTRMEPISICMSIVVLVI
ncbi:MAG: hypothetical protein R2847_03360 [Bacteroidia bacterium]